MHLAAKEDHDVISHGKRKELLLEQKMGTFASVHYCTANQMVTQLHISFNPFNLFKKYCVEDL